jgi:hypothetical protein
MTFLSVGAHADDDKQRNGGRFAVEPHARHSVGRQGVVLWPIMA